MAETMSEILVPLPPVPTAEEHARIVAENNAAMAKLMYSPDAPPAATVDDLRREITKLKMDSDYKYGNTKTKMEVARQIGKLQERLLKMKEAAVK